MNEYQSALYADLMNLCDNDAFYFSDYDCGINAVLRTFMYRLASYSDFMLPNAMECRGHTFLLVDGVPVELTHLPMQKFFNWKENPHTMFDRFENVTSLQTKADGSLISVSTSMNRLMVKSKTSFTSEHATASNELIMDNLSLYAELFQLGQMGYTVNMEYCSPEHRIVIGYDNPSLVVLNVRYKGDGSYVAKNDMSKLGYFPSVQQIWVEDFVDEVMDHHDFIEQSRDMVGIEGYVVWMGYFAVKVKTNWYSALHRAKDSINTGSKVMEAILNESIDDLKSMFAEDAGTLIYIQGIEDKVVPRYNRMIKMAEDFYEGNNYLDQKSYAMKAKGLDDGYMFLYMCLYNGKPFDYKKFAMTNSDKFLNND